MGSLRAGFILAGLVGLTAPLMPVQALLLRIWPQAARRLPHWYHKAVCRLLGIRLKAIGEIETGRPVLLVSNHASWLDIPVLSSLAPVSFVAKREVSEWPIFSTLARLQRTVFVDRERKSSVGDTANEILLRLASGDAIVLFPEGTSSDGNRVLPFRSPLFAAAKPTGRKVAAETNHGAVVQTVSLVYKRIHGVSLSRQDRHLLSWYGDMELTGHVWQLLKSGPIDIELSIGPPVALDTFADRKHLARQTEVSIRTDVVRLLRGLGPNQEIAVPAPPPAIPPAPRSASGGLR